MPKYILFLCLFAVALVGCDNKQPPENQETSTQSQAAQDQPLLLRVGHVGHDHHLALYVAALQSERFKADYDLYLKPVKDREVYELIEADHTVARLQLLKVGGGSKMPAAMSRGEIDIGLGGVTAVAAFADEGEPFKILCPLQTDGDMLVMLPDSPAEDWASFVKLARESDKPLRIGYKAPVAVAKLIFERALQAEGLKYTLDAGDDDIDIVLINFGSEAGPIPLMERGELDGYVMNQPGVAMAVHKGVGKVIAQLRDLPPAGQWVDHPCCCVTATETTMAEHHEPLVAFLKLLLLSTQLIQDEPQLAIDSAVTWAKNPREVEQQSIPTISYVCEPTESWLAGMRTWAQMAEDIDLFKDRYAEVSPQQFVDDLCDLSIVNAAMKDLRDRGMLQ